MKNQPVPLKNIRLSVVVTVFSETFSIDDEPSEDSVVSVRWIIKALNLAVQQDFHDVSELLVSGVMSRILAGYPPRTLSRAGGYASMYIRLDVTWVAMILRVDYRRSIL